VRVIREPAMLTDRNDLDDQLFGQGQLCHAITGQMPSQSNNVNVLTLFSWGMVGPSNAKQPPQQS
jgi:hypothetical protein